MGQTEAEYERHHQERVDAYMKALSEMTDAERAEFVAEFRSWEEWRDWYADGMVIEVDEENEGVWMRWPGKTPEEVRERFEWFNEHGLNPGPMAARLRARFNQ
jgi:hypothetical protein